MRSQTSVDVIRGGDVRKRRWIAQGCARRGGTRVICYLQNAKTWSYFITFGFGFGFGYGYGYGYGFGEREVFTPNQVRTLAKSMNELKVGDDRQNTLQSAPCRREGHEAAPDRQSNALACVTEVSEHRVNVRASREAANICRAQFAKLIGVIVRTLQNWERHRTRPTQPARVLLEIVSNDLTAAVEAINPWSLLFFPVWRVGKEQRTNRIGFVGKD